MKTLTVILLSAAVFFIPSLPNASATTNVDFSVLGSNSVDITLQNNPAGFTLDGINFGYDNFGSPADLGIADSSGLVGTTYGGLVFNFLSPAKSLSLDFSVLGVSATDPNPNLESLVSFFDLNGASFQPAFYSTGIFNSNPSDPSQNSTIGKLVYSGPSFNRATMFFSPAYDPSPAPDAPYFSVSNISYETVVTPEPASLLLFGIGGGALAVFRKKA